MRAADVLSRATPLAFPVAKGRKDDDLVTRLPCGVAGLDNDARAVGGDDPRWCDALRPVRKPEVEMVDGGGPDRDCDRAGAGFGPRAVPDSDSRRPNRLLVNGGPALAQNNFDNCIVRHDLRNLTNPPPVVRRGKPP